MQNSSTHAGKALESGRAQGDEQVILKLLQFIGAVSGGKSVTQVALGYLTAKGVIATPGPILGSLGHLVLYHPSAYSVKVLQQMRACFHELAAQHAPAGFPKAAVHFSLAVPLQAQYPFLVQRT